MFFSYRGVLKSRYLTGEVQSVNCLVVIVLVLLLVIEGVDYEHKHEQE